MLYSKFSIGEDRYVIEIKQITVVAPHVNLKTVPSMPDYAAGLFNYRGLSVPVIDLCQLLISRPCVRRLSTRIIVTKIKSSLGNDEIVIGFLVENATDIFSADDDAFVDPGMKNPDMPFIGPVASDSEGMITKITPQDIFVKMDENLFFSDDPGARAI